MSSFEPKSGRAYRKVLSRHAGFYEALSQLVPTLTWHGCRIPVSHVPDYGLQNPDIWKLENDGWATGVLERLGLPMYYSAEPGGAVFLDGFGDWRFSNSEIQEMFRGTVFLAAETAKRLNDRGFLEMTGVEVRPWTGARPSGEDLGGDRRCPAQKNPWELVPISDQVRWDSTTYHLHDGKDEQPLFPGAAVYRNPLGGTTVVFCGTPKTMLHYTEGFSFLNESRKAQMVRLMKEFGHLPVYYPDDAEVYLRAADTQDGELLCAFFNIGLDPIEEITLTADRPVTKVEKLSETGERQACAFAVRDGVITVQEPANILDPVILFLS